MLKRAFHPRPAVIVVLAVVSAVGLAWCFLLGGEGSPASYVFYALSAYALAMVVVALAPLAAAVRDRALRNRHIAHVADDEALRAGLSAAWSVLFDLAYAAFTLAAGFAFDSGWALAVALYHVVVVGINLVLAIGFLHPGGLNGADQPGRELRMALAIGVLLAIMALSLTGVMALMVFDRQAWVYDEITVIAIATFTFVNLVLAIRSAVRVRRVVRPSVVASRVTSLSKTLVQLFFLETTMIAVFGGQGAAGAGADGASAGEGFRFAMEAATGVVVFLLVLAIAVALIVFSARKLRK